MNLMGFYIPNLVLFVTADINLLPATLTMLEMKCIQTFFFYSINLKYLKTLLQTNAVNLNEICILYYI